MYLNVNKIDVFVCFSKIICSQFLLTCFKVRMSKISDINVKLIKLITTIYSGIHFLFGHSVVIMSRCPYLLSDH